MLIIDAHLHYWYPDPAAMRLPEELDLKLLNVCVAHGNWRDEQAKPYRQLAAENPKRFAWCTSFDLPDFVDPAYAQRVIAQLDEDFAAGAVGCKIWKHVGMELLDGDGRYALPDDDIFDPIYAHLAKRGWTLLAHIAEPLACWEPLDPASPHYTYYSENPQWHMAGRMDIPSHATLMAARDRVLQKHPKLRMVGAHLGSLEYSLEEIADRFERYPSFAVDTSARLGDLKRFPRTKLREFIERYQDRILFGTDAVVTPKSSPAAVKWARDNYAPERAFFETDLVTQTKAGESQGLALPAAILEKLYVSNAQRWYPGL